jgi:hypothetical protein
VGGGLHGYIGGWIGRRPLLVGLDLGILNYGRTTDQVPFSRTVGPRVPVEVSTNNNVVETHLSLRLQPRTGRFRPYVEGLAGFKYLFTRTTVGDDDFGNDELGDDIAESTNYDDFALSGGAGAGIDVRVYQQREPGKTLRAVDVHLGVQYLLGQEAEYLAEGDLTDENENGQLDRSELDVRRSRTTFLQPQFGVTFRLAAGSGVGPRRKPPLRRPLRLPIPPAFTPVGSAPIEATPGPWCNVFRRRAGAGAAASGRTTPLSHAPVRSGEASGRGGTIK